jgi:hypothetical protein
MRKIIRLTESDLRGIVQRSVLRVLQEQNDFGLLLQSIAQSIVQKNEIDVNPGENDLDLELQDGRLVYIKYNVLCNPYLRQGMKSSDYDVPDDPDEIIDDWDVEIIDICLYDYDNNEVTINDNGIVRESLKRVLQIDYSNYDVPSEDDYYSEY